MTVSFCKRVLGIFALLFFLMQYSFTAFGSSGHSPGPATDSSITQCSNLFPEAGVFNHVTEDLKAFVNYAEILLIPKGLRDGQLARQIEGRIKKLTPNQLQNPVIASLVQRGSSAILLLRRQSPTPAPTLQEAPPAPPEVQEPSGSRSLNQVYNAALLVRKRGQIDQVLAQELRAAANRELSFDSITDFAVKVFELARVLELGESSDQWSTVFPLKDSYLEMSLMRDLPDGFVSARARLNFRDLFINGRRVERIVGISFLSKIDTQDRRAQMLLPIFTQINSGVLSSGFVSDTRKNSLIRRLLQVIQIHKEKTVPSSANLQSDERVMIYAEKLFAQREGPTKGQFFMRDEQGDVLSSERIIEEELNDLERRNLRNYLTNLLWTLAGSDSAKARTIRGR